jgi:DNA-binding CsgD family transcriptional regulator/tetratricopeptide (TPR) repeat protein
MDNRLPGSGARTGLWGREQECARLDELVSSVRRGESRSLVLRGEAGIGKTALLEYLIESASHLKVARATGVESEMELAFASLHQLCAPLLDRLERLPTPQHDALRIVFGLSAGPAPDPFLVGLAVLSLLSEVAEQRPLLCVVDDAHWLDQTSALTLGFVARRLWAEPVGLVFAAREPGEELRHVPDLEVHGLPNRDARALLGSAVPFVLDERVRDRIIAETRGNPLALLELSRGLTATQLAGGFGMLPTQALPGRIEEGFVRRLASLPEDTRALLLVAAAEPIGDPRLLWRAAERLGIGPDAAEDVEVGELLAIGERVTFRHPLVRSAMYRSAAPEDRRAAHLALAEVTDPEVDPDRLAWHRAAAAPGPDEDVAMELERSAARAQARGGLAAGAAFLERSVALTREPARRAQRALAAAKASLHAGAYEAAARLLATADAGVLDELQRTRVELLRAQITSASSAGSEAPGQLLSAAKRLEPVDPSLARETYLDAWGAALFAGGLASGSNLLDVSRAARSAPRPPQAAQASDLLLDGLAVLATEGRAAAAPMLKRGVTAYLREEIPVEKGLQWGVLASTAAVTLWDFDSWDAVITRQMELTRDAGALAPLSIALNGEGIVVTWRGDFAAAALVTAEADAVTEATGTRIAPYGALLFAALRGREAEAIALIEATIKDATAGGEGLAVQYAHWTTAVLYNGIGRYEEALAAAQRASDDTPQLFISAWALTELIVASTRTRKEGLATDALERLAESTSAADADWGPGILARSRALLSEGEAAESSYREAIDRLSRSRLRPELARSHLNYGEWLRREHRRVDAREQLRKAHGMLTAIGMDAFAERAREELLATGEHVRKRSVETRDELTAQERRIAQLAQEGLSNPEIGARLFLSPRTVEWHLRKVFAKLGIRSRRELANALPSFDSQLASA